jgi:hypothetical protein
VVLKADYQEALMTNEELLRERVAKLEVQMTHLSDKLDDTHKKVEECMRSCCRPRACAG